MLFCFSFPFRPFSFFWVFETLDGWVCTVAPVGDSQLHAARVRCQLLRGQGWVLGTPGRGLRGQSIGPHKLGSPSKCCAPLKKPPCLLNPTREMLWRGWCFCAPTGATDSDCASVYSMRTHPLVARLGCVRGQPGAVCSVWPPGDRAQAVHAACAGRVVRPPNQGAGVATNPQEQLA
jgi:hypothetical protein